MSETPITNLPDSTGLLESTWLIQVDNGAQPFKSTIANLLSLVTTQQQAPIPVLALQQFTNLNTAPNMGTASQDIYYQAIGLTCAPVIPAPTGTPTNGQILEIGLYAASAYGITWNAAYAASGTVPLPQGLQANTLLRVQFQYDSTSGKYIINGVS